MFHGALCLITALLFLIAVSFASGLFVKSDGNLIPTHLQVNYVVDTLSYPAQSSLLYVEVC